MIKPTVGRKVWYRPGSHELKNLATSGGQPLDATIVCVHSDSLVNVACYDANGTPFTRTSVHLHQEGVDLPAGISSYVEWMPYQNAQAAKHEAEGTAAT
jgi:hypothetical protein